MLLEFSGRMKLQKVHRLLNFLYLTRVGKVEKVSAIESVEKVLLNDPL